MSADQPKLAERSLIAGAALALVLVMISAARIGWADFGSMQARNELETALTQNTRLAAPEWVRLRDALLLAAQELPQDPQSWERLGTLYLQRATGPKADPVLARPYYQGALPHLRRALALRPTSPYTAANLALAKRALGELDAEFERAVLAAASNGPWETPVLLALLEISLTPDGALPPKLAGVLAANAERAVTLEPKRAVAIARERAALPWLCQQARARSLPECSAAALGAGTAQVSGDS